jgi:hypothetical protein
MPTSAVDCDGVAIDPNHKNAVARIVNGLYSIKVNRGTLVDPIGIDSSKVRSADFDRVSEHTYKTYLQYLLTKNSLKYTQAERSYREQI